MLLDGDVYIGRERSGARKLHHPDQAALRAGCAVAGDYDNDYVPRKLMRADGTSGNTLERP
jgi:hypothetical protein